MLQENNRSQYVVVLAGVAFSLNGIWINLIGYSPAFSSTSLVHTEFGLGRYLFLIGSILAGALLFTRSTSFEAFPRRSNAVLAAVSLLGTATTAVLALEGGGGNVLFFVLGYAAIAFGGIWNSVVIMAALARHGSSRSLAACFVGASLCFRLLLSLIQSWVSPFLQIGVALVFCGISFVVLAFLIRVDVRSSLPDGQDFVAQGDARGALARLRAVGQYRAPLAQIVGACLAVVFAYGISRNGIWGGSQATIIPDQSAFLDLLIASGVFVVMSVIAFGTFAASEGARKVQFPFIVLITGVFFLVACDLMGLRPEIRAIATSAVDLYCQALSPFVIVCCARALPFPAFKVVSASRVLVYVLALGWLMFLEESGIALGLIVLLAAYLFMMVVAFTGSPSNDDGVGRFPSDGRDLVISDPRDASLPTVLPELSPAESDPYGGLLSARDRLSAAGKLTPRETEVLGYLLQGRSLPYISQELFLSNGTLRTHTRNIYRKLKVHSKQELIDLVGTETDGLGKG